MSDGLGKFIIETAFALLLASVVGSLIYAGYKSTSVDNSFKHVQCFNQVGNIIVSQKALNVNPRDSGFITFTDLSGKEVSVLGATCIMTGD